MSNITITTAQLSMAQTGKEVTLATGAHLIAVPVVEGEVYKYILSYEGVAYRVRYITGGVEAVTYWLNASDEEYSAD